MIEPVDYSSDSDTPFSSLRRSLDFLCPGGSAAKLPECMQYVYSLFFVAIMILLYRRFNFKR